jgi:hypothetical protein
MAQAWLGPDHVTVLPGSLQDLLAFNELPSYSKNERGERLSTKASKKLSTTAWNGPSNDELASHLSSILSKEDPLSNKKASSMTDLRVPDYLADGVLDACIEADETARFRLRDAIDTFKRAEDEVFAYIAKLQGDEGQENLTIA